MSTPFSNHVSLPQEAKTQLVDTLNSMLATTSDLRSQVKQAHWNIKGPQFVARHELFDNLAAKLLGYADVIAERAATLGGYATGTVRQSAEHSKLPEYDVRAVDGKHHIKALVDRYSEYTRLIRHAVNQAEKVDDPATEDVYTEILRGTELDMWFLESHLNV
ncbi:MAG: DNA starvation/stationary phase protection protein Dps [Deltaproteobacteria bacterium]|nr:DNA starvation/stationary phase protection protein Dps [Deltaproteobacteria bacterium]NND30079.1 DNA starvation/stationary phase protection protein Dps [Myxococcales bacterium]MBT8465857.1 DNA starvation/stationary phase protection protein Dps [Deltaproteobacteria bacterium]MBT8481787.1 DNA starvation/stationary phase protection protein Dps [Deltaproteobacteria bacterium]NNK08112.1 DNA starvation/stationary phase protection protein Dps [Myxococcales bacterium]